MSYTFMKQPKNSLPSTIEVPTIDKKILSGGDVLYTLKTEMTSLIQLEIKFPAGSWYQQDAFQALLTGKMLSEGTQSYNSQTIAETIDFYGGYYAIGVDKDFTTAQFVFPKTYLHKLLPIISEILFHSIFPESELKIAKDNLTHQIRLDNQRGDVIANKKLFSLIYGEQHPYGKSGQPEEVAQIDQKKILDFHRSYIQSQNSIIFIVGDIDDNDCNAIENYLSPTREIIPPIIKAFSPNNIFDSTTTLFREQSTQASIRMGKVLFTKDHPDYLDLHIATTILGGYFGSRLMNNLREEKGYTYGVGSYLISYLHSGFFGISTEVGIEHADDAICEILHEIDELHKSLVPQEELLRVKNYLIGSYLKNFEGPFNIMNQHAAAISHHLPENYIQNYLDSVTNITAERIQALFHQHLNKESLAQIIVRKPIQ